MKVFLLWFALGFFPVEKRVDRFPASGAPYSGCDSKETAVGILVGQKVPASTLYHYGKKEILMKDVKEGNVPQSDWNEFIMGEKTRFKLKRFRRGLYGTERVEDADRFGDSKYNWLIAIQLDPQCLVPQQVVSIIYLPRNPSFQKWYESRKWKTPFQKWREECFDSLNYPRYEKFKEYSNPDDLSSFTENDCEKVVGDFFEDRDFSLVQDHAGDLVRSWSIRKRNCIRDIRGTPEFWVSEFAANKEIWTNSCDRDRNHRNNVRVWFQSISEVGIQDHHLRQFDRMIQSQPAPLDAYDWQTEEMDRFAAQDFSGALENAAKRCGSKSRDSFKKVLSEIASSVDQLQSSEVKEKLEGLCR